MKKYWVYMRRLCALLLVLSLVISQDMIPVHALTDEAAPETEVMTESEEAANVQEEEAPAQDEETPSQDKETPTDEETPSQDKETPADEETPSQDKETPADEETPSQDKETPSQDKETPADETPADKETPTEEDKKAETPAQDPSLPAADEVTGDEILPEDPILPDEEQAADDLEVQVAEDNYPEGSIHVNPSDAGKLDPLGGRVTVAPGNNESGDGTLAKPYYSLGKAYNSLNDGTEGEKTENIYVHSGVIIGGTGNTEKADDYVGSTGDIASAEYFADNKGLTIYQADDLDALFAVEAGSLTLQNMTMKLMDNAATKDAKLRIALSGGKVILKEGLTVPADRYYFRVNAVLEDETAPMEVDAAPGVSEGGSPVPVIVSEDLLKSYLKTSAAVVDEKTHTTTQEWSVKIPIATVATESLLSAFTLKGIGTEGVLTYDPFTDDNDELTGEGRITEDTANFCTKEWNKQLSFELEDGVVYLTGYHKTVKQEKISVAYKGVIYVGEGGNDSNDGVTKGTRVVTLNKAKELLDYYDAIYKADYPYPKIVIANTVNVTDVQSLDFKRYETSAEAAVAPSSTGYRASLWLSADYGYYYNKNNYWPFFMQSGGTLNLGEGVIITDSLLRVSDETGKTAPEDVPVSRMSSVGLIYNGYDNTTINLKKMSSSGFSILIKYYSDCKDNSVHIEDSTIKGCNMLFNAEFSDNNDITIEGESVVECNQYVFNIIMGTGYRININLDEGASVESETGQPTGKGYLYSATGGIIDLENQSQAVVNIEKGLLAGNDALLLFKDSGTAVYMKDGSKYYQNNKEKAVVEFGNYRTNSYLGYLNDTVYYQGGDILSMGKAFVQRANKISYTCRLILDGGKPTQHNGDPLKIVAADQTTVPFIYLGSEKEEFYSQEQYHEKVELELYDKDPTTPFQDMSKIVGRMNSGDRLRNVKDLFKLCWDGEKEIYEGKALTETADGDYLVIGINGIYIDGVKGGSYPDASGSLADPVRTFWDAQQVYNHKSDEQKKKLKGIYILNEVTIGSGMDITVAGEEGAASQYTNEKQYICNFNNLPIYDTGFTTEKPANAPWNYKFKMIDVNGGKFTLDHVTLDGSMIVDNKERELLRAEGGGKLKVLDSIIQNLKYDVGSLPLRVTGSGSELYISNSSLSETECNSSTIIYCEQNSKCTVENSSIKSEGTQDGQVIFVSNSQAVLTDSSINSNKKAGICAYDKLTVDITDSEIVSKQDVAIKFGDSCTSGRVNISGGTVQGTSAVAFGEYYSNSKTLSLELNVKNNATLKSTKGHTIVIGEQHTGLVKATVNLSGAKISAASGNGIYFKDANPESSLTMNTVADDEQIEINTEASYDGIVMVTGTSNVPIHMGGHIKVNEGEKAGDLNLEDSESVIYLKQELSGDQNFLVKAGANHAGEVLVDCTAVETNASQNQDKFTLHEESLAHYGELGISFQNSPHPDVEGEEHLVIPPSTWIFWDWENGDDRNSEKEGGGHSKKLAVKSPNGVRAVLRKEGFIDENGKADPDKTKEPVRVLALSKMEFKNSMNKWVDGSGKCYGDTLQNGSYTSSTAENPADVLNWNMPKPEQGTYLIDMLRENKASFLFNGYSSDSLLKIQNVKFTEFKTNKDIGSWIHVTGNSNLQMENCYFDLNSASSKNAVIYLGNSKENSIRNVKIEGNYGYGVNVSYCKDSVILDQVQITGGDVGVNVYSSEDVTIRGDDTKIELCYVSKGKLKAEGGTITDNQYFSTAYSKQDCAVYLDRGVYIQTGNVKIQTTANGIWANNESGSSAYLYGGIIENVSEDGKTGIGIGGSWMLQTVYVSGVTIRKFITGISQVFYLYITDGSIAENKIGINTSYLANCSLKMSGGSVSRNEDVGVRNFKNMQMTGGEICENGLSGLNSVYGGIYNCSQFTMTDGRISGNKGQYGGGISNCNTAVLISGGVIENNEGSNGGGIYQTNGTLTIEGGSIRYNRAKMGAGIYTVGGVLKLLGGEIFDNQNVDGGGNREAATGEIYCNSSNVEIGKKGSSYPKIKDTIYLANRAYPIKLTAAMRGRYTVRVNEKSFREGDTVVVPDGNFVQSAAAYLTRFTLLSDSLVLARKGKNLVLDGVVFVDGMADQDGTGTLPNNPRNNFISVIQDSAYANKVIYIVGAVHVPSGKNVTVTDRTIRRYTGQPINGISYPSYDGPLFIIDKGATLTLLHTTVSGRMGVKSDETYDKESGYLIENYGILNMDVENEQIAEGVDADNHTVIADNLTSDLGIAQHGTMNMSPYSQIDQTVRLGGTGAEDTDVTYGKCFTRHSNDQQNSCTDNEDRIIHIYGNGDGLKKQLRLDVDHKCKDRIVTSYKALSKEADLQAEKALHQIKDLETSGYYLASNVKNADGDMQPVDMILREPGIYYVDGTDGNDETNNGTNPSKAFRTLQKAYEQLAEDANNPNIGSRGGLIYIVKSVPLENLTIEQSGDASVMTVNGNSYNTQGAVTIRRYSKPTSTTQDGYDVASNQGTMFTIPVGSTVSIQGVTIDGHSQNLDSEKDYLKAEGVTGADAIFEVSGTLNLGTNTAAQNTRIQNNDASGKNGGLIRVENGGSLHITGDAPKAADLDEGQAAVYGTVLTGGQAAKGSAIYAGYRADGTVLLSRGAKSDYPQIDGDIYFTGNGTESSFLTVTDGTAGAITDSRYALEVQDAYDGRLVVRYPSGTTLSATDVKGYTVSGRQGYDVTVKDEDKSQIILKALGAVYIDGVNGKDTANGQTPATAVKTLNKAYTLLKANKGGMLYVVNTVEIADTQKLTETSYTNYGTSIVLDEGTVQIQRYGKPRAYGDSSQWTDITSMEQFNVGSNKNALFRVTGSGMLDLQTILIDGHRDAVTLTDSLAYKINADAVDASAPLIQVAVGGKLNLGEGAVLQNNNNTVKAGKFPGGAIGNAGTVTVTGGTVQNNSWTGTADSFTVTSDDAASKTIDVTPNASGIWQAGTLNFNVTDASKLNWKENQYIYLAEQDYDASVSDQDGKDAKVSFLNIQALPSDVVLPLDLKRRGTDGNKADGWFAPGRKIVEMNAEGTVTAANFTVNSGSYVGCWWEGSAALTEKLTLAEREGAATILELQRAARDCIIDVIVPVKASAGTSSIHNLSEKAITASGAVDETEISARRKNDNVTIREDLSDTNRIKLTCSDGK